MCFRIHIIRAESLACIFVCLLSLPADEATQIALMQYEIATNNNTQNTYIDSLAQFRAIGRRMVGAAIVAICVLFFRRGRGVRDKEKTDNVIH